jgi:hypothetical protein
MSETVRWMLERIQNYRNINKTAAAESKHASRIVLMVTGVVTAIDSAQSEICQFFHNGRHREAVYGKYIGFVGVLSMRVMVSDRHIYSINAEALQPANLLSHDGKIGGGDV